jgi:hypothetical protein
MHQIKVTTVEILNQLKDLASYISDEEFSKELSILLSNSVGRHYRHIIEFYMVLFNGLKSASVNYDNRKHDPELEQDRTKCIDSLDEIISEIQALDHGKDIKLEACYSADTNATIEMFTGIERELVYNIEHAIHHMAIIKIGINHDFAHVKLPENFGFAYSTIKHKKS